MALQMVYIVLTIPVAVRQMVEKVGFSVAKDDDPNS